MSLSKRTHAIKESPTLAILGQANQLKAQGEDIIILAAGEPDFETPDNIKQAAISAIQSGKTRYTAVSGIAELKTAIANKLSKDNNLSYQSNEIIVSNGAKQSIHNVLQALLDEGDEVIIPAPYWVSYPDMVLLSGGLPVIIKCDIDTQYKLSADKLRAAITHKTKAIILNSPSNPTGMIYSKEELQSLAEVLLQHPELYVISDDIYEHILFEGNKFHNIINANEHIQARTIIINGVSKAYAMTGWRIGYAACKDIQLVKAMDKIQSQSTSGPCSISQYAALEALTGTTNDLAKMRLAFSQRKDYIIKRLRQIPGIKCLEPQGAFYAFFECREAINTLYNAGKIAQKNDMHFSNYLLHNFGVAGVPGSAFGLDEHIRLSFAASIDEISLALDRIESALK